MDKGWFDNFSSQTVDRIIDSNGIASYSITTQMSEGGETNIKTKNIELLEMFFMAVKSSKKLLTPELKRVIEDFNDVDINGIWGQTEYTEKTPLGHAIDEINVEAVEYLIQRGADVNIKGTNQKHILQELLSSNATDKRVQILEKVLEYLTTETIQITKGFDGKFYTMKYLVPLVNSGQISSKDVEIIYNESTPKQKSLLEDNCNRITVMITESQYPQDVKDIFLI
jgi:hypothetical protein